METFMAMAGKLAGAGIEGSTAGTTLKNTFLSLAAPTAKAAKQLKKLGIQTKDSDGNLRDVVDVFGDLQKATAGMGTADRSAVLERIFGKIPIAGVTALLDIGADKIATLRTELEKTDPYVATLAATMRDTVTGDIDEFTSAIEGVKIALFDMNTTPIRDVIKGMTAWVKANQGLIVQKVGDAVKWISDNLPAIVTWVERIAKGVAVFYAWATAVQIATSTVAFFQLVMAAGALTFAGWAIAIVAAIALIVAFWPEISKFFTDLWKGIVDIAKSIGSAIYGYIAAVFGPIKDFLVGWFEFVVGAWTLFIGALMYLLQPLFDWLTSKFTWLYETLLPIWTAIWDAVGAVASASWGVIAGVIGAYVDVVKAVWSTLIGFFTWLWDGIKSIFWSVMGPIFEKIEWAINKVRSIGRQTLGTEEPAGGAGPVPQVAGPADRAADRGSRSVSETTTTNQSELLIRDTTGKATMSRKVPGITLQPTGAF